MPSTARGRSRCRPRSRTFTAQASAGESPPLAVVIIHLQHRADAGEGANHDADKCPVAQAGDGAGINRVGVSS
jgi:hypothetical protein